MFAGEGSKRSPARKDLDDVGSKERLALADEEKPRGQALVETASARALGGIRVHQPTELLDVRAHLVEVRGSLPVLDRRRDDVAVRGEVDEEIQYE
jgi:hypothetical protein